MLSYYAGQSNMNSALGCVFLTFIFCAQVHSVIKTTCDDPTATFFEGFCFKVFADSNPVNQKNWIDAQTDCQSNGGNLATIPNHRTEDFLENLINTNYDLDFWIGYTRNPGESEYHWQDGGNAQYSKWLYHPFNVTLMEPTLGIDIPNEYCVVLFHSPLHGASVYIPDYLNTWGDTDCTLTKGWICQYQAGHCSYPLLSGSTSVPLSALTATSAKVIQNISTEAFAILGTTVNDDTPYGAWSIQDDSTLDHYIQVDLQAPKIVRYVLTQGRNDPTSSSAEWVRSFYLFYSLDGNTWTKYGPMQRNADPEIFYANTDRDTVKYNELKQVLYTRYIRINPIGKYNAASMRFELLGCELLTSSANIVATVPVDFYRTDAYLSRGPIIETDKTYMNDMTPGTCYDLPTEEFHTSWMFGVSLNLITPVDQVVLKLSGKNFPCIQSISGGFEWPVVSVHGADHTTSQDDFDGNFESCDLLIDAGLDYLTNDVECTYLCSCPISTAKCSRVFINIMNVPAEVDNDWKWKMCDIGAWQTD